MAHPLLHTKLSYFSDFQKLAIEFLTLIMLEFDIPIFLCGFSCGEAK